MLYQVSQLSPDSLARAWTQTDPKRCFIGFDAFTDDICALVDQRLDYEHFTRFADLGKFAEAVACAAGNSANFELLQLDRRIGGNAANLAKALCSWNHSIHLAATVGTKGAIEPLFASLADACCEIFPMGPSPHTDALEFQDGKLLLGKMGALLHLSAEEIVSLVGPENLSRLLTDCDLFASTNWTMLAHAQPLWQHLRESCFADLPPKQRFFLVDLADPRKRPLADLQGALQELSKWQAKFDVVLSVNCAECAQVSQALGIDEGKVAHDLINRQQQCAAITERLQIKATVVHGTDFATVGFGKDVLSVVSPYCAMPATTTGGGDHFNAGLCHALLCKLAWPEALAHANATSGYFVRFGKCPSPLELGEFFQLWQSKENG